MERPAAGSLGLDVCCLDDRPPLLDLGLLMRAEALGGLLLARREFEPKIGEPRDHRCLGQGAHDRGIERADDVLRRALGRPERLPDRGVESGNPASSTVGMSGAALRRLLAATAKALMSPPRMLASATTPGKT